MTEQEIMPRDLLQFLIETNQTPLYLLSELQS